MTILQYLLTHISYRNRNKVSVWTLSLCKAYFEDVGKLQSCSVFLGKGKSPWTILCLPNNFKACYSCGDGKGYIVFLEKNMSRLETPNDLKMYLDKGKR